jgi:thioredoxin 1
MSEPTRLKVDTMPGPVVLEFGADMLAKPPQVRHMEIEDRKGRPLGRSLRVKLWPTQWRAAGAAVSNSNRGLTVCESPSSTSRTCSRAPAS